MNDQQLPDKLNRHLSFLEQDQSNLTLLVKISDIYLELDDLELAQSYLDKAKAINHEACLGHQGLLYLNQGLYALNEDFIKAEQLINKANNLNPDCFLTEIAETICFDYKTKAFSQYFKKYRHSH
jgi:tetratricopeptide (TPR) repeat protein